MSGPVLPTATSRAAVVVSVTLLTIAVLALGFRLYAQHRIKRTFALEDCAFLIALVANTGVVVATIYGATRAGLGWPVDMLSQAIVDNFDKALFAGQLLWGVALGMTRAGLLLFYRRIFDIQVFRRINTIVLVVNFLWLLAFIIALFVQRQWKDVTAEEQHIQTWLVANGSIDLAQDLVTLSLPILVIRTLNLELQRKLYVAGVFLLGAFCIVASIVRVKYLVDLGRYHFPDPRFVDSTNSLCVWSMIQPLLTLIAACLPGFPPAFKEGRQVHSMLVKIGLTKPTKQNEDKRKISDTPSSEMLISKTIHWSVIRSETPQQMTENHPAEVPSVYLGRGRSSSWVQSP